MSYCSDCKLTFKSKRCLQAHLKTKKHLEGNLEKKYKCTCGKSFTFNQGLHAHKKKCTHYQSATDTDLLNARIEELQKNQEDSDIKKDVKIESYKKEIECLKGTILCQKELIQTLEKQIRYGGTMIKSANRRKISPKVRKEIVDQQESKCGGCEAALTEYYEIDHIIGLQFGGTNDTTNLMALCCECHAKKSINENKNRNKIKEAILTILTS